MRARFAVGLLVLVAGLTRGLAFAGLPLVPMNDSVWYLGLTHVLSADHVFDMYSVGEPTSFDITYALGYPLFLDLAFLLFRWERLASGVVLLQHVAGLASVLVVYRLGVALGRPVVGVVAALAYTASFATVYYAHVMMSESLFVLLNLLGALYVVRGWGEKREGLLALGGAFLAMACLFRSVAVAEAVAVAGVLVAAGPDRLRARLRRAILVTGPAAGALAALWVHNALWFGQPTLTDATGRHLIDRVWAFDRHFDPSEEASARILTHCRDSGIRFRIPGYWWDFYRALRVGSGLSAGEADELMARAALASVPAYPLRYVGNTGRGLVRLLTTPDAWIVPAEVPLSASRFGRYLRTWTSAPPRPESSPLPPAEIEARRDFVRRLGLAEEPVWAGPWQTLLRAWARWSPRYAGAFGLAMGLALLASPAWGRREDVLLAVLAGSMLLSAAALEFPFARYREPVLPFLLLLTAAAAWEIGGRIARRKQLADGRPR